MSTVDVHAHYVSPKVAAAVEANPGKYGVITSYTPAGELKLKIGDDVPTRPVFKELRDLDERRTFMKDTNVDRQVISTWLDTVGYNLPAEQGAAWSRLLNDTLYEDINETDRAAAYSGVATVPLQDGKLAAAELEYCVTKLGFKGAVIATNVVGKNLDEKSLEPFWEALEGLKVPMIIHPFNVGGADRLNCYFLNNLCGNPMDTTVAAASLVLGGVADKHPDMQTVLVHGGGFFPYQIGRFERGYHTTPATREFAQKLPKEYLRYFYYDTILHHAPALQYLIDTVGIDRVVLGSDYPFQIGDLDPTKIVHECHLDDHSTGQILGETATQAFRL